MPVQTDKEYKDSLIKNIFGSGGKAILSVVDKHGKRYSISRIQGERVNILDEVGNDLNITALSLFDGVQYFGQKDLSSSSDHENCLLEKFVSGKVGQKADVDSCVAELITAVTQLLDVGKIPAQIEETTTKKAEVEHRMSIFKEKGVDAKLKKQFNDYVAIVEDWILNGGKEMQTIISSSEYAKLSVKLQEQYSDLIKRQVMNKVEIYYHEKLLRHHSIGQRASALILFILAQSDNDIILIDQPEDDLDNKIIYDEVISSIVKKKQGIQFIFATHNANIPVLGDAERVLVVEYQDTKIDVSQGNIDLKETHKQIVDIMEGGKEAFDKRQLIYTSWK